MRNNGRPNDKIRDLKISRNFLKFPDGSVLVEMGESKSSAESVSRRKSLLF